jgi:HSP20 family protein
MKGLPSHSHFIQETTAMRVIKWEPFRDMDDAFDRFFADAFRRMPRRAGDGQPSLDWAPPADVSETEGEYLIKAEIAEVPRENLSLTVQDGVLTLSGERRQEKREDGERMHRVERQFGSFARRFALPDDADDQAIRAESRDGIVTIHIPKHKVAQPQPRQIPVQ